MKIPIIATLIILCTWTVQAQITLEHTYNYSGTLTEIDEGEFKYFVMDVPENRCSIFNEDHTAYKTINLSVPSGFYLNDIKYLSRKIFNGDDKIELLYLYYKVELINSQSVYTYGLKVVNEDGTVLLNLGNGGFAEIKDGSDGPRLMAYQYIWNDSYYLVNTLVYTLGSSTKSIPLESSTLSKIYPNPVDNLLNINIDPELATENGSIYVTDISGRRMMKEAYIKGSQNIQINTKNLPEGTYIVNFVTSKGLLISEKIEKK